jgi:hypothetical protein
MSIGFASSSSSPSPSTSSWWDGVDFESYEQEENSDVSNNNPNSDDSRPKIQIPCGLIVVDGKDTNPPQEGGGEEEVSPLTTIIDTNQNVSTIHVQALKRYPHLNTIVRQGRGNEDGKPYMRYIPTGTIKLRMGSIEATIVAPKLLVVGSISEEEPLTEDGPELRLGMNVLWDYGGIINYQDEQIELQISPSTIATVPFIRPRPSFELDPNEL